MILSWRSESAPFFQLTVRRSYGRASSLGEAKAEYEAWNERRG